MLVGILADQTEDPRLDVPFRHEQNDLFVWSAIFLKATRELPKTRFDSASISVDHRDQCGTPACRTTPVRIYLFAIPFSNELFARASAGRGVYYSDGPVAPAQAMKIAANEV